MTPEQRLMEAIRPWEGTPWVSGWQCRGAGVDCIHFVVAVMDELERGAPGPPFPRIAQDTALHSVEGVMRVVRHLVRRYPGAQVLNADATLEPGDVIICRVGRAEGHVLIVGAHGELWNSQVGAGVTQTTLAGRTVMRVFRSGDRSRWINHGR